TYTYTVTNTGDVPLTNVVVTDDKCSPVTYQSGDTNSDSALDLTETWTYTCTATINVDTTNVATVTGEAPTGDTVTDNDSAYVEVINPGINIVKTADQTIVLPGTNVTYTYTLTNTGDVSITNVVVTDDKCSPVTYQSGDTNIDSALDTNETWTYTCTATITEDTTNVGTATGETPTGNVTDNDTADVDVINPGINIVKTADKTTVLSGTDVIYTYVVTNNGDVPLTNVVVTDDKCSPVTYQSGDTNSDSALDTTETWTYTCTATISVDTTNTATVTGETPGGDTVTDNDTAYVDVINPQIHITKTADPPVIQAGDKVTYTYMITNTGDVTLINIVVTDDKLGYICTIPSLDPWASSACIKMVNINETTTNVVVVNATTPINGTVTDNDTATVEVICINIIKTGPDTAQVGETVIYEITISNCGDVNLSNVTVTDALLNFSTIIDNLGVGESVTLYVNYTFDGSDFLNLPDGVVTATPYTGADTYFDIALSDVPSGQDVANDTYLGWCADRWHGISTGVSYPAELYSSYESDVPEIAQNVSWNEINYIINNRDDYAASGATRMDIQCAIWHFTDGLNTSDSNCKATNPGVSQSIVDDAYANGGDFIPGPGDRMAVIVYVLESVQQLLIAEVEVGEVCITNTVNVTGQYNNVTINDSDNHTVCIVYSSIEVIKTADKTEVHINETVTYTYLIK
ncbi:MAG: hypothetical protein CVT90_02630, partial [Candidatus Altiarchaeales archaeon HGW-Altiarchaeales-3]